MLTVAKELLSDSTSDDSCRIVQQNCFAIFAKNEFNIYHTICFSFDKSSSHTFIHLFVYKDFGIKDNTNQRFSYQRKYMFHGCTAMTLWSEINKNWDNYNDKLSIISIPNCFKLKQ